jgi:hypothetical protein
MRSPETRFDHNPRTERAPIASARSPFPVETAREIAARRAFDEVRRLANLRNRADDSAKDD